jgi:hypothetical protein
MAQTAQVVTAQAIPAADPYVFIFLSSTTNNFCLNLNLKRSLLEI